MKFFKIYIFPALYGLLIYFTVRLLHDVEHDSKFWERDILLNLFEMATSVVGGYLGIGLFEGLFRFYNRRWLLQLNYRGVAREIFILIFANLILVNAIFLPMAAFTDDGLSWADGVDLNMIPTLYAIIYYGIARTSTLLKAYVDSKLQLEKVTTEHLQTELKFLKSQYHPHFLFNALNTIYFQMDEDLPGAKRSIEKFSELLRYQLYDQQQHVPVTQEIEYLQGFIELQKIRSTDKLKLTVNIDPNLKQQLVYPLLFLPLVENAFKFVGGDYNLLIIAELNDGYIHFNVENSIPSIAIDKSKAGGIGLENLERRLKLLYPDKHLLKFEKKNHRFKAELKLKYE